MTLPAWNRSWSPERLREDNARLVAHVRASVAERDRRQADDRARVAKILAKLPFDDAEFLRGRLGYGR